MCTQYGTQQFTNESNLYTWTKQQYFVDETWCRSVHSQGYHPSERWHGFTTKSAETISDYGWLPVWGCSSKPIKYTVEAGNLVIKPKSKVLNDVSAGNHTPITCSQCKPHERRLNYDLPRHCVLWNPPLIPILLPKTSPSPTIAYGLRLVFLCFCVWPWHLTWG